MFFFRMLTIEFCIYFVLGQRYSMLEDMDDMEAICISYAKDGTVYQQEQSNIRILTVTKFGIIMLNVLCELVLSISFM